MLGKKPLDQSCEPAPPAGPESNTTYAGRFSFSLPKPYVVQAPREGRPPRPKPLCMNIWAGAWLISSVCRLRTTHNSSATPPRQGRCSTTSSPTLPCLENRNGEPARTFLSPINANFKPSSNASGQFSPCRFERTGFGSSMSNWDGAPTIWRWITDFARGLK